MVLVQLLEKTLIDMSINLIEASAENNFKNINFLDRYDHWIFDLDNTIYDFKLGLFRRISIRMTEYIKNFFNLDHQDALNLQKDMYKKYGLTLRGLIIEKKIDPEPFLDYVHDVDFNDLEIDYDKDKFKIKGKGNVLLQNNSDQIEYKIFKQNKKTHFNTSLTINNNELLIDFLNYKKNKKTKLEVQINGSKNLQFLQKDYDIFSPRDAKERAALIELQD